ncbi:precorrin-3B C(17)-methyltransferase [Coleofasciculus sp. FACHB-1120]|uniref:precorrin-3B C(17)-methyltransferase n=1 Tax=Coleofasciculus sp. FACHB-1120 TaxID=2692783 RepID=UPI00168540CD|nr:precorrin-3B C(17)-methyltransferase [Coleofasciculus sp. FACHB-1120]MBD2743283.1 precorrin-3B C(17)-methyltransferase [Coleofasciculus sp. FACHB-1120]
MVLLLGDFQPLAAIATTPTGAQKLQPLCQSTGATLWVPESLSDVVETRAIASAKVYRGSLKDHLATLWNTHRGFVFCLASGAVVRLIAPLLQDKSSDPAVVVVDENSQFVISLCSGHQGGADRLAQAIALTIGATPVLTGASTGLGLPAVDMLGVPFGWNRGEGDWTGVSAAVARGERVQVIQEAGSPLWQSHLPENHPFDFRVPEYLASQSEMVQSNQEPDDPKSSPARIWISPTQQRFSLASKLPRVQWHPRVLWVGIGCERGTSKTLIETAIGQVFEKNHLAQEAIAGIATIDIKASEVGLVELCRDRHLPLRTFPADILRSVSVPTPSAVVEAEVGTPSVAEAAAIHAASVGAEDIVPLKVAKQVFKLEGQPGAVTVAIAQSEQEYTGRTGCLLLVGTGPGKLDQMTPAAQTAVSGADAIIGYSLYIDLISPLLRPGQIVEALPITQERQRAERAIELANWGLTVAVVSSGDCGIYGMAGLVMEELQVNGWDGKTPGVQVFPGITALQAAASRVGAPLMHDFCAISLSDLLTPWEVIEKRLSAAAQADFVTALYNPRSQTRTQQIAIAQTIFLQYRDRHTPVAIVKSAYREDEQITLITLEKLLDTPIDMLTTVLIGNSSTRTHADWMITPRGYLGFNAEIR